MDLSAKVKEVLRGESPYQTTSDTDMSKTPGSFPTEGDSTPRAFATSGSEQNKLHKPDDPRGWNQDESMAGGHGYTDPDAGLTATQPDSSYTYHSPNTQVDNQRVNLGQDQGSSLVEKTEFGDDAGAAAGTTMLGSDQKSSVPGSVPSGGAEADHPYWGSLPQGSGVYNTVTGHGSKDDESRYRTLQSQESETSPVEATSRLMDDDAANTSHQRALPVDTSQSEGLKDSQGLQSQNLQGESMEGQNVGGQGDSHYKEGIAGGAAAGVAAAGVYGLSKKHEEEKEQKNTDDLNNDPENISGKKDKGMFGVFRRGSKSPPKPKDETTDPERSPGHKEGRSFSLFHRGSMSSPKSKDEVVEPENSEEKKEGRSFALFRRGSKTTPPDEKQNILAQETTPEKDKKSGGFFRSSRHNEKGDLEGDLKDRNVEEKQKDERFSKAAPALALAGAGGAAAYTASKGRDDDLDAKDKTVESQDYQPANQPATQRSGDQYGTLSSGTPSGMQTQDSPVGQDLQSTTMRGNDQYGTLPSGTSSGMRTQDSPAGQDLQSTTMRGSGQSSDMPSGSLSGMQTRDSAVSPSKEPLAPTQGDSQFSSAAAYGAAGLGAAGLGAGLLASERNKTPKESGEQSFSKNTSQDWKPSVPTGGVAVPTNTGNETTRSQDSSFGPGGNTTSTRDVTNLPEVPMTKHANKGEYNMLASGTPSGIKLDDDAENATKSSALRETQMGQDNLGSKAATGLGAAGLGAAGLGTGAFESRRKDEKDMGTVSQSNVPSQSQAQSQEMQDKDKHRGAYTAAGLGAAGLGAAAYQSRKPDEDMEKKEMYGKSTERDFGQPQGEQLSQTKDKNRDYTPAGLGAAGLGAAGLGAAAYESRKPDDQKIDKDTFDKPAERDFTQPQSDELSQDKGKRRDYTAAGLGAAGLGAAGLGAAAYKSRHQDDKTADEDKFDKPLEQGLGKSQTDSLSQDRHRDARAAAATAFGSHRPSEKKNEEPLEQARWKQLPQSQSTERSLPLTGGLGGNVGSNKVMHRCTECGKENDISHYFNSAMGGATQ